MCAADVGDAGSPDTAERGPGSVRLPACWNSERNLTDQGTLFMSRTLRELYELLGIQSIKTSMYHPQTDGLIERFNKTL